MKNKRNKEIKSRLVRIIHQTENKGIIKRDEALNLAKSLGLDLIEISRQDGVSICKIENWGKFQYDESKKNKHNSKKEHEIRIRVSIDSHDLETKINNINKFLAKGDKVKIIITFKGRQNSYVDSGFVLSKKIIENIKGGKSSTPQHSGRAINFFVESLIKN